MVSSFNAFMTYASEFGLKVDYHGAINVGAKAIWIRKLLGELGFLVKSLIVLHCENRNAI